MANDVSMQVHHRPGTWDRSIFLHVMQGEYGELNFPGAVVLDIGAHIGSFSMLAAARGAARVVALEPGSSNFELLQRNALNFPVIETRRIAAWPDDNHGASLIWRPCGTHENTGGASVLPVSDISGYTLIDQGAEAVGIVVFDELLCELGAVDILKIDAEGSEYPLLLGSSELGRVRAIVGEYHAIGAPISAADASWTQPWNVENLVAHLQREGFQVARGSDPTLGIFHAWRP